jgi:RNA-directed DNA polymerase
MTISYPMGAPARDSDHWNQIDWHQCRREVRKLQVRIVKAVQEGRWHKVKSLQWLLTHSFSAKALAVKRVTENQGKRTAGVDKARWTTPNIKWNGILSLSRRGYRALPLRRVYIPKSNGKLRPLGIPTMRDRAMQALYLQALEPVSETTADPHSYGFRPKRSTADAVEQCFNALSQKSSARWVLEADIQGCFDNFSHDWLLANIPTDKAMLATWLKAGFMDSHTLSPTIAGTPQGGIISPTVATMALDGLQARLTRLIQKLASTVRGRKRFRMNFVRYADDFIVTGHSKEFLEQEVRPCIEAFLAERGLTLSTEKTRVTPIEEGFDFLGINIRRFGRKLLTRPAQKSIQSLCSKLRGIVKGNSSAKQINVIRQLNPVIRGWAQYHRHGVAKEVFGKVDSYLWLLLWHWAKRRHPNKGARWVKAKYFRRIGSRDWIFAANESEGSKEFVALVNASDTPIRRHLKIQSAANPFDLEWYDYFARRQYRRLRD